MIKSREFVLGLAVVSAVGFLCYLNTLKAEFAYDDKYVSLNFFSMSSHTGSTLGLHRTLNSDSILLSLT